MIMTVMEDAEDVEEDSIIRFTHSSRSKFTLILIAHIVRTIDLTTAHTATNIRRGTIISSLRVGAFFIFISRY